MNCFKFVIYSEVFFVLYSFSDIFYIIRNLKIIFLMEIFFFCHYIILFYLRITTNITI
jgi:hypothetical protein